MCVCECACAGASTCAWDLESSSLCRERSLARKREREERLQRAPQLARHHEAGESVPEAFLLRVPLPLFFIAFFTLRAYALLVFSVFPFPFYFFSFSLSALVRRSSLFSKRHEPESVRELCSLPFLLRYERRN